MIFRKSNICSHTLDVREENVSVSWFYRVGAFHHSPTPSESEPVYVEPAPETQ